MSAILAPYNESMRLGSGFNSYTQQLCVNDAVVKQNSAVSGEKDLKNMSKPTDSKTSQNVKWTSRFVDSVSDVTNAMNISGALEIKYQGMGAKASGSYLDTSKMKNSDLNYFVQVKVVNQQLVADDVTKFNAIPNVPFSKFTEIYGDSFISGFLEGGEFNALMSVKVHDKADILEIKGAIGVSLEKAGFGINGEAKGSFGKADLEKRAETSISVSWAGGGDITPKETIHDTDSKGNRTEEPKSIWDIHSMAKAAFEFPANVLKTPQRTHAVVTKYSSLRSYQELTNKGTPLDYENAGVYTNTLLEDYMEYKDIWTKIHNNMAEVNQGGKILMPQYGVKELFRELVHMFPTDVSLETASPMSQSQSPGEGANNHFAAYGGSIIDLEKARRDCRHQMLSIVKEVDAVTEDPKVASDENRVGRYLSPLLFSRLLPEIYPRPSDTEIEKLSTRLQQIEAQQPTIDETIEK